MTQCNLVRMKILYKVALIPEIKSFGYTSNDEVKGQYNDCMMKGEVEKICNVLCNKDDGADHGTEHESDDKCDKCRGTFLVPIYFVDNNSIVVTNTSVAKTAVTLIFRWTSETGRALLTKTICK